MARTWHRFALTLGLVVTTVAMGTAHQAFAQVAAPAGWLGVAMDKFKGGAGVLVTHVVHHSPAAKVGLVDGDRIVRVDGLAVSTPAEVSAKVAAKSSGSPVVLSVLRGGKALELTATLMPRPSAEQMFRMDLVGEKLPNLPPLKVASGGGPVTYPGLSGRVVLLDLFATWCGPCLQLGPYYHQFHDKYAAQGLTVLAVSPEEPTLLAGWATKNAVTYTVASDPTDSLGARLSAPAIPASVLVDKHGVVREVALGFELAQVKRTEQLIQALLKEP